MGGIQLGPSQVLALRNTKVSAFHGVCLYGDGIPDQAKCPHYRKGLHFRGICKVGFHCIVYLADGEVAV